MAVSINVSADTAVNISSAYVHSCAVLNDGRVKCWGDNEYGKLGDGSTIDRWTPVSVSGINNAIAVATGYCHSCAMLNDGKVKCWGCNWQGELGDGSTTERHTPVSVSGITNAIAVAGGLSHSCALLSEGTIKCWGYNTHGQLGDNTTTGKPTPINVVGFGLILPTYTNFSLFSETTKFSEVVDITNVINMTLAITGKGKIRFGQYGINAEGADLDNHIKIENSVISVNTSALDPTINNSATLTFENVACSAPYVYYSETATTRADILTENNLCLPPRCTNIQCNAGTLTVDVTHFSGYAVNGSANLTIDANDPKHPLELVTFTAEYRNATGLIEGATCNISFSDGSYIMDEQVTHYNYSRTFASAQIVGYNVTCSATGENTVFANDTAVIQSVDIPEFSLMTLGLGLTAVLAGLIIIRKKH